MISRIIFIVILLVAVFFGLSWAVSSTQNIIGLAPDESIATSTDSNNLEEEFSELEPEPVQQQEPPTVEPPLQEVIEPPTLPEAREGAVYVSRVSRPSYSRPGYVQLRTKLSGDERVTITGWRIESNTGSMIISQAVPRYTFFDQNVNEDIVLERGDYAYIYFEKSPISKSFRLNQCTGYLNARADFSPVLPNNCPQLSRDSYQHLSGDCQNYIRRLRRCELPDPNLTNAFLGEDGNECRAFINKNITIAACYQRVNESDFFSNEWRVWVNRGTIFDFSHDWVRLYNTDGMLIDEYTY